METMRNTLRRAGIYLRVLGKWLALSAVIGALCGLLGTAFHVSVEYVTELRLSNGWIIYTLPAAGLLAVSIYRLLKTEGQGTNDIIREVQEGRGLSLQLVPAIFLATGVTHLAGGSAGREGAALQMGGALGYWAGRGARLRDQELRIATQAGMAAFFSALFGTPVAAAVFALTVISVGRFYHAALLPCLTASLAAYAISLLLGVEPTRFAAALPAFGAVTLLQTAALAALCALVSVLFCACMHQAEHWMQRLFKSPWLRAAVGGALLLALTLIVGNQDYNGAGMGVIRAAVEEGRAKPAAFLLKMLFTAVTLACGFKGGEVVPSFFVGAAFGCVAGPLLGLPAGAAAAIGLISVFCGATNCPIASTFLAAELFGGEGLPLFALACAVSYVLSGYSGIYSSQRILYDKLAARYIDARANAYHQEEK